MEIKFVYQLLICMEVKVRLSIVVYVENLRAVFMSEKLLVSKRTKHVDICYRFIQEFVLDSFIKVVFVRNEDKDADILKKNLGGYLHRSHSRNFIVKKGKSKQTSIQQEGC